MAAPKFPLRLSADHILAQTGIIVIGCSAWLFLSGWTYFYTYFGYFHIGISQIIVPEKYFFTYGVMQYIQYWFDVLLILLGFGFQIFMVWKLNVNIWRGAIVLMIAVCTLVFSGYIFGKRAGLEKYLSTVWNFADPNFSPETSSEDLSFVTIKLRSDNGEPGLAKRLAEGCFLSLWSDVNSIFVVDRKQFFEAAQTGDDKQVSFNTRRYSWSQVDSVTFSHKSDCADN